MQKCMHKYKNVFLKPYSKVEFIEQKIVKLHKLVKLRKVVSSFARCATKCRVVQSFETESTEANDHVVQCSLEDYHFFAKR